MTTESTIATPFRAYNFCAGPCALPLSVLESLSAELIDFNGTGMSLIEMSHRGPEYDAVHHDTLDRFRRLFAVPEDFSILLLQGGATLQFAMAPMNCSQPHESIGYVVAGTWGKKAVADARVLRANTYEAWNGSGDGFRAMPTLEDLHLADNTRYLHVTSNETIGGIRMSGFNDPGVPMVADMSSDYLSRPIPWDLFDVVYGGAQKNLGPAGLAVVFVRNSVMESAPHNPAYLTYKTHADADSMANTPPVFPIWATGKVLAWMEEMGGVEAMQTRAAHRSSRLYSAIDASGGFYRSPVNTQDRSHMNVVFRLGSEELEKRFVAEATSENLLFLKGHRSVGGIRASIYNATPDESVDALIGFMSAFASRAG
ncbi:MAG: 3-phosphoserine/phosphohydroxythreonine transaminase [Acidimicrobiales bacterium]